MKIDFWVDPACPFCWTTARWVVDEVQPHRDIDITWRPISLLFKNEPDPGTSWRKGLEFTHGLLRVMESVRTTDGNDGVFQLYWEFGARIHHDEETPFDPADALAAVDAGANRIDAAAAGLGAGAGNTPMEVFIAVCARMGIETGVDVFRIQDVAEDLVVPMMDHLIRIDRDALTLGYAGVDGSFLLPRPLSVSFRLIEDWFDADRPVGMPALRSLATGHTW